MMNKKGISIGRIILYCFFLTLLGLLIYSIILGVKGLKDKTPETQHSYMKYAYNSNFDYSAADYISSSYMNFYMSNDFVYNYINGNISYNLDSINVTDIYYTNRYGYATLKDDFQSGISGGTVYSLDAGSYCQDNVFPLSNLLYDFYKQAVSVKYNSNTYIDYFNLPNTPGGNQNRLQSASLILNCDIPITLWEGQINGYYQNSESWLLGDNNVWYKYSVPSIFTYDSLPSDMRANCSTIKKIILPVWQQAVTTGDGLSYYFLYHSYNYNYNSVITDLDNPFFIRFTFNVFTQSVDYQDAYDRGYNDGVSNSDAALREQVSTLSQSISDLNNDIDSLNSQIEQQLIANNSLQEQLNALQSGQFSLKNIFFTIADVPFKTVHNMLDFQFFGVNLFQFFIGIITALGLLWLIKRIIR